VADERTATYHLLGLFRLPLLQEPGRFVDRFLNRSREDQQIAL
jgi:hypothetical protein